MIAALQPIFKTTIVQEIRTSIISNSITKAMTIINTALVTDWSKAPSYTSTTLPSPSPSQLRLSVLATGLHNVVRSRASGTHYSSGPLPHVPGIDGIGKAQDGKRYYFTTFAPGAGGSFASEINVEARRCIEIPEELDAVQAAAMVNPALSSWMAMKTRATDLPKGFSVLVLGATSASGKLAIALARALGAGRVVGAARNPETLSKLGLDEVVVVNDDPSKTDFGNLGQIDLVLDYIYGPLTAHLLSTIKTEKPLQYVHIGGLSGQELMLPGAVLRSKDITIRGSGPGAWGLGDAMRVLPEMLEAFKSIEKQPVKEVKLADVESEWATRSEERVVFVP